jgi:hypothetical protein
MVRDYDKSLKDFRTQISREDSLDRDLGALSFQAFTIELLNCSLSTMIKPNAAI